MTFALLKDDILSPKIPLTAGSLLQKSDPLLDRNMHICMLLFYGD